MTRKTKIQHLLIGLQAVTALLCLAFIAWVGTTIHHDLRIARWMESANALSNTLISVAAAAARERGYAAAALGNLRAVDLPAQRARLLELRHDTNRQDADAMHIARTMAERFDLPALAAEIQIHAQSMTDLNTARGAVDKALLTRTATLTPGQWLTAINNFIASTGHMRTDAFQPLDALGEMYRDNLQLKEYIAEAGDYAGRERALIGELISADRPPSTVERYQLFNYRNVVDLDLLNINLLSEHKGIEAREVFNALARLKEEFGGRYQRVRERVYQAMDKGEPYPVTVDVWLTEASRGIDTILALMVASNQMTRAEISAIENKVFLNFGVLAGACLILALGLLYAMLAIRQRILVPLRKLEKSAHAISDGNLDCAVTPCRDAELNNLAESFDHMRRSLKTAETDKEQQLQSLAQANIRMTLYNEAIEHIASAGGQLARDGDTESFYRHMLGSAMELTMARYGACGLFTPGGDMYRFITLGISDEQRAQIQSALPTGKGLLSAFYHEGKVTRVDCIADDPRACGFPPGHPPMRSLLGMPLRVQDKIRGVIYLSDRSDGIPFNDQDEMIVGMLVTEIEHALERNEMLDTLRERSAALQDEHQQQQRLITQLQDAHSQLLQAEKMASVGQLAAGVAHEINNPVGYINSNVNSLNNYLNGLLELLDAYMQSEQYLTDRPDVLQTLHSLKEKIDIDFLKPDLRLLIDESLEGLKRVKQIVQDLKDFSHVDASEWQCADLHKGLDSTLNVARNEIKYKAEVVKEYGELPPVECLASQINQVFMNLLVNAAHAIEQRGVITVRTGTRDEMVWIEVRDTGKGIAEEHLQRIFDPFFTTKPVGTGTGLGLSLSYGIIKKHHGRIEVESAVGKGTCFRIWLPINAVKS